MFKSKKSKAIKKDKKEKTSTKVERKEKSAPGPEKSMKEPKKHANRKYTEEGFKIYSTEELKIGQGGDTADCPFDCECCF